MCHRPWNAVLLEGWMSQHVKFSFWDPTWEQVNADSNWCCADLGQKRLGKHGFEWMDEWTDECRQVFLYCTKIFKGPGRDWQDGPVVKSTYCPCRRLKFRSQHPQWIGQLTLKTKHFLKEGLWCPETDHRIFLPTCPSLHQSGNILGNFFFRKLSENVGLESIRCTHLLLRRGHSTLDESGEGVSCCFSSPLKNQT